MRMVKLFINLLTVFYHIFWGRNFFSDIEPFSMLQNGDENAYACIKAEILKYPSFAQFQIF
jgi:hypothetical protein